MFLTTAATDVAGILPNMEAYYSFDDDTANDGSGNGRDGIWQEGTETYTDGSKYMYMYMYTQVLPFLNVKASFFREIPHYLYIIRRYL